LNESLAVFSLLLQRQGVLCGGRRVTRKAFGCFFAPSSYCTFLKTKDVNET
jgi:hypothetical protein